METVYCLDNGESVFLKNLYTGSICEIEQSAFIKFRNENMRELIEVIDKDVPFIHSNNISDEEELSFYIVTTMDCNLTCTYCFENGKNRNVSLSEKHINKVLDYINDKLSRRKYNKLDIYFTGGEPLYNYKFIEKTCLEIKRKITIPVTYTIITNGTVLNRRIIDFLVKNNFKIQISFDGNEYFHNLERKNRLGKGTYRRIIDNISAIFSVNEEVALQIRINISSKNYQSISELYLELKKFNKFKNCTIYFDFVAVPISSELYVDNELKKKIFENILHFLLKNDMPLINNIRMAGYCMYKNNCSSTIHADGHIYKCYSLVGDENYISGDIDEFGECIKGTGTLCFKRDCPYFEFCYGGCPYNSFVKFGKMMQDCQYDYLDYANKLIFLSELGLFNDDNDDLLQKIKILKVDFK